MLKRLPKFQEVISVYAVIAAMLFAWSLLLFFWYLPSWLHFMGLGEVVGVFSYVMASSFVESLSFLLFLLFICFILPPKFLRDEFAARGTAITLPIIGLIMIYFRINNANIAAIFFSPPGLIGALAIIIIFYFSTNIQKVRRIFTGLSDRLTVFLYILVPLSIFALLVILVRNIV